jgi:hypothetical protein
LIGKGILDSNGDISQSDWDIARMYVCLVFEKIEAAMMDLSQGSLSSSFSVNETSRSISLSDIPPSPDGPPPDYMPPSPDGPPPDYIPSSPDGPPPDYMPPSPDGPPPGMEDDNNMDNMELADASPNPDSKPDPALDRILTIRSIAISFAGDEDEWDELPDEERDEYLEKATAVYEELNNK